MGLGDILNSATGKVKQNAPDLSPVIGVCRSSYNLSWAALYKIDHAIRVVGVQKAMYYLPDEQGCKKIGRIFTGVGKYAADVAVKEALKPISGGVHIHRILHQVINEAVKDDESSSFAHLNKESQPLVEELKMLKNENQKLQEEVREIKRGYEKLTECTKRIELHDNTFNSDMEIMPKPEDVISIYMMRGCQGRDFLDGLIIPKPGYRKNLDQSVAI